MRIRKSKNHISRPGASVAIGERFGKLVILSEVDRSGRYPRVTCRCDCGKECRPTIYNLRTGNSHSCGCWKTESVVTHGKSGTAIHYVWSAMRERCNNPNNPGYPNYGGRGIKVCKEWDESFEAFYKDMGEPPPGLTLDRIDVNLGYFKANCRWADWKTQANNRQNTVRVTWDGETCTLQEWAEFFGVSEHMLRSRLSKGWSFEDAVSLRPKTHSPDVMEYRGLRLSMSDWARMCGVRPGLFQLRKMRGWSPEQILTTPVRVK